MATVSLRVTPRAGPLDPSILRLLAEADARIERFLAAHGSQRIPAFVPSEPEPVVRTLAALRDTHQTAGDLLLEWGSGFGVVTMAASLLGFRAAGIEVERELVEEARRLAVDLGIPASFVEGSFLPEDLEFLADGVQEYSWLRTDAPSGYDELDVDPDEVDVVFAYPWPGEERVVFEAFERTAATGALLVTWHGKEGVRVRRKRRRRA